MSETTTKQIAEYLRREPIEVLIGFLESTNKTGDELIATITALRAMLKRLEWRKADNAWIDNECPICEGEQPTHAPGCELDALLKESEAHNVTP